MSYVLCSAKDCAHHDGEGCMLETVEVYTTLFLIRVSDYNPPYRKAVSELTKPNLACCRDYEPSQ